MHKTALIRLTSNNSINKDNSNSRTNSNNLQQLKPISRILLVINQTNLKTSKKSRFLRRFSKKLKLKITLTTLPKITPSPERLVNREGVQGTQRYLRR